MTISLNGFDALVAVGHCVIIQKNVKHAYRAKNQSRFLVADLLELPQSAGSVDNPFATISSGFKSFCLFADIQLRAQTNAALEQSMVNAFKQILSLQDFLPNIDRRISRALEHIENDLAANHTLASLAAISSLSVSQFKVLFNKHTGKTLGQYLLSLRMDKARAFLANTDLPVSAIGEKIGYTDPSAFARRFQRYHGIPPRQYKSR